MGLTTSTNPPPIDASDKTTRGRNGHFTPPSAPISFSVAGLGQWPDEVSRYLENPRERLLKSTYHASGKALASVLPASHGLRLVAGCFSIPPIYDASVDSASCFTCEAGSALGVVEVVSRSLINAGQAYLAEALIQCIEHSSRNRNRLWVESALDRAEALLDDGCRRCGLLSPWAHRSGIGLASVISLDASGSQLGFAEIHFKSQYHYNGAELWHLRRVPPTIGQVMVMARLQSEPFGSGNYLPYWPNQASHIVTRGPCAVREGDLLVLGCGGFCGQLSNEEISGIVEWTLSPYEMRERYHEVRGLLQGPAGSSLSTDPANVAVALANAARSKAVFDQATGDDVTVACAWVVRSVL